MRNHLRLARILITVAALALACTAAPAFGQENNGPILPAIRAVDPYSGKTVGEVRFRGLREDNRVRAQLQKLVSQKQGKPLDRRKVRESLQALFATGRFANLEVEAEPLGDQQLRLIFVGQPNSFVGALTASGAPKRPTNNQLIDSSKLRLGEVVTTEKLAAAIQRMKTVMRDNGYYQSEIAVEQTEHPDVQLVDLNFVVTPKEAARIGTVKVEGDSGFTQQEVEKYSGLKPGKTVTQERLTKALQKLRKKYTKQGRLESEVAVTDRTYHSESNTVDYALRAERGPTVDIHVEGANISGNKLKKYVPIYEENAVDTDLLNEGRKNLRDYLQTQGYFATKVEVSQDSQSKPDHLHIIYDVDRGDKRDLVQVDLDIKPGKYVAASQKPPYFRDEELRERLQVQVKSLLFSHGHFSQGLMSQDVDSLTGLYRANGFSDVKVEGVVHDDYEGQEGDMAVTYKIDEGPQSRVASVVIEGNKTVPTDQLPGISTAEGQIYSDTTVAGDRDEMLNYYFDQGFPNAQIVTNVSPAKDEEHAVNITFSIDEGEQVFIDQILTSGLDFTKPQTVTRQFEISQGDPLNQTKMSKTQSNLYNLGVFNEVRMAVQNPDGSAKYKDVLMQFTEAKRWTFNYGLGLEASTGQPDQTACQQLAQQGETSLACSQGRTGVSPRATFDVSRINFRGLAHTLTFSSTIGRLQKRGLFSYEAPRWFGKPNWKLSFTAFYDNSINVTTFTSERLEGSIQAEQTYSRASHLLYRFTYRRVKASNVVVSPDQVPLYSRPVRVGMPSFSYIRDKRDDAIDTRNGNFTSFDAGVSTRYFGSQASFSRFLAQNSTYHPFKQKRNRRDGWVFARNTRIGVAEPFGNDFIPLPERFFAGGSNSFRGFALNQAGPRDLNTGSPLGGNAVFVNTLELRTPSPMLPFLGDNVSFAFFHDMGNVFQDGKEMVNSLGRWHQPHKADCRNEATRSQCSFAYVSHAIGSGVRYKTPIGPVRVDFGYNLNPPVYPSFEPDANGNPVFVPRVTRRLNVFFSIGQTF